LVPQAEFIFMDMANAVDGNGDGDYEDEGETPPDIVYFGRGGQNITIFVEMNEPLKRTPAPTLSYIYNYGVVGGDTVLNVISDSSDADSIEWYYDITLADGDTNDAAFHAIFTAQDRSGNPVENFVGADIFQVDNIHPPAFGTGTVVTHGEITVEGWFNGNTDSIEVKIPIVNPSTDSTLYLGGSVDVQLYNITRGTQWVTVAESDSIIDPGDSISFFRIFDSILTQLPDGTDLVLGDSIKVRGKVTDRNGNETIGTESTSKFV
ncbi:uncharacterized protein METZ01_LOCUS434923, partial [marine metagenome]